MGTAIALGKVVTDTDTDIMRIISSFFVIMIHLSDFQSFSSIFYNAIAHFSVPVFVIISGYYMLSNKVSGKTLTKKIIKLFVIMIFWSLIYLIFDLICKTKTIISISGFFSYLLTEPGHLWYIYAAITLYLFTPLFAIFHNNANKKTYLYALTLTFLFGSLITIFLRSGCFPILEQIIDKMKIATTFGFVFLYFIGGYFNKFKIKNIFGACIMSIGGSIVSIISSLLMSPSRASLLSLSFFAPNTIMAGMGFFLLIKNIYLKYPIKNIRTKNLLHSFSGYTLGIYLLHPMIIKIMNHFIFSKIIIPNLFNIPVKTFFVFTVSSAVIFLFKRLPLLKSML